MKHYLIDGYNFIFKTNSSDDPLKQKREAFHKKLLSFPKKKNVEITVVYDGNRIKESACGYCYFSTYKAYYTSSNQSADDYILEVAASFSNPSQLIVVTSDKYLAKQCQSFGIQTITSSQFEKLLQIKKSNQFSNKPIEDTDQEKKRLANIFNKRLKK